MASEGSFVVDGRRTIYISRIIQGRIIRRRMARSLSSCCLHGKAARFTGINVDPWGHDMMGHGQFGERIQRIEGAVAMKLLSDNPKAHPSEGPKDPKPRAVQTFLRAG